MSFKTILTHVVADQRCDARLRMTAGVAKVLRADVIGYGAQAPWPYSDGVGRGADFEQIVGATKANLDTSSAAFHRIMSEEGVGWTWRQALGYPDIEIPNNAAPADLVVAYGLDHEADTATYATPDTMVMATGLPVLLLPNEEAPFQADRILFAWKNTREARHALSTFIPLMKQASRVLIAAVCKDKERATVEAQLSDVVYRLGRHGVQAQSLVSAAASGSTAQALARIADQDASETMVLGAYGHSRFREWALGGVTRDLIDDGGRYIVFAH